MLNELLRHRLQAKTAEVARLITLNKELDRATMGLYRLYQAVEEGVLSIDETLRARSLADLKMNRLLDSIDERAKRNGPASVVGPAERYAPTEVGASPRLSLVLGKDVRTVIWATGFRPDYSWLDVPVFDRKGELKHDRGVIEAPGLYVLGLPYLRRRKSSFMHGAEDDVRELGAHLADHLDRATTQARAVACRYAT